MLFGPAAFVMLLAAVALFAGLVALQFAASRARNAIAGLVLPIASLVAAIGAFRVMFSAGAFFASVLALALYCLPAVVFTLVYVRQRRKMEMLRQLNKMNVQDL